MGVHVVRTPNRGVSKILIAAVAVATMCVAPHLRAADHAKDDAIRAAIQATLDRAKAVAARGGSAEEFARTLDDPDLMITGQGDKTYYGRRAFVQREGEYIKEGADPTRCFLRLVGPIRHSGELASAFIHEYCNPDKKGAGAYSYRVLAVFRDDGPHGWREIQELFVEGNF